LSNMHESNAIRMSSNPMFNFTQNSSAAGAAMIDENFNWITYDLTAMISSSAFAYGVAGPTSKITYNAASPALIKNHEQQSVTDHMNDLDCPHHMSLSSGTNNVSEISNPIATFMHGQSTKNLNFINGVAGSTLKGTHMNSKMKDNNPPRPPNAYILYRQERQQKLKVMNITKIGDVSKITAKEWRKNEGIKRVYKEKRT
ncbi:5944_t:CDS:1, partial [Gigaspora margarita]